MSEVSSEVPSLAFVGVVVPDDERFHGPAFNRAAQLFQRGMIAGLGSAGLQTDVVFGLEPVAAFPRTSRLWSRGSGFTLPAGTPVRLLPFINLHPLKWFTAGLSAFVALVRWHRRHRHRPRVVLVVNLTMPPGVFVLLASWLMGARSVVALLDVFQPGGLVPDTLYHRLDFALQRWLIPKFDGWMVVSQAIAEDFLPGKRVCRVEGGIEPTLFEHPLHQPREDGVFRLVLSGAMEPHNGVDLLLAALPHLPDDCEVVLAGSGSLSDAIRRAAAGDPRLIFRGFLDFSEVLDLYRSADLLLNVRLTHALDTRYFFPSKLMEFLASGVPVLSTCTGHVEEEYGGLLYLLRTETPEALAECVREIRALAAADRAALGERARRYMLAEKTWPRQGEKLARYVRDVVSSQRGEGMEKSAG